MTSLARRRSGNGDTRLEASFPSILKSSRAFTGLIKRGNNCCYEVVGVGGNFLGE